MFKKFMQVLCVLSVVVAVISWVAGLYLLLVRNMGVYLHLRTGKRRQKGSRRLELLIRFKNARGEPIVVKPRPLSVVSPEPAEEA